MASALRRALKGDGDPYLGNDLGNANRLVGLAWLFYAAFAAVLVALSPPSGRLAAAGLALAVATVAASIVVGATLLKLRSASFDALIRADYLMVVALAVLQLLSGGSGVAYHELSFLLLVRTAAVHPPWRVAPYALLVIAAYFLPLTTQGTHTSFADLFVQLAPWPVSTVLLMVVMAELRRQRLAIRSEGERAHTLARTDPLTSLGNRRQLVEDLDACIGTLSADDPWVLALFDLDGFKAYNDSFGHPAGDSLLARLGEKVAVQVRDPARVYRMGGDEFCILGPARSDGSGDLIERAQRALSEQGEGFAVTASYGSVRLPTETADGNEALRIADGRMYAHKNLGRASAGRQSTDVLLKVLAERSPELGVHMNGVTELCQAVGRRLGLGDAEIGPLMHAASLHDIGKAAIPDAILNKPDRLTPEEWEFIHRHTLIGERIVMAAPALASAARLVRSSHERFDGNGYPDRLAGDSIPLGSRIIAVCDAYDAMTTDRPYRTAMSEQDAIAELEACAGTQFDETIVDAFREVLAEQRRSNLRVA